MEIEGIEMTDLVQKIAKDACRILGYSMVDSIVHEKLREAIRQALAQSGEAACYGCSVGMRLCDDGLHRDPLGQVFPHTATIAHPAPSADRVAELEAQLAAEQGLSERWRQRTLAAEKQLAESEKKREAVTSDWSKLGAKLGLLQMQLGATERQLAESREREGRLQRDLLTLHIIHDGQAVASADLIAALQSAENIQGRPDKALAAEQEKK